MNHRLIGEILTQTHGLSLDKLDEALNIQEENGGRIGEILIRQNAVSEIDLLEALSIQFGMPFSSNLPVEDLITDFTEKIPIQFLKKYKMVPIITSDEIRIAANDPLLFQPIDDLRLALSLNGAEVILAPNSAILSVINFAYDLSRDSAEQVIQGMHEEDRDAILSEIEEIGDLLDDTSDAPIIKLANLMFTQAVKDRASDIHIEPSQNRLKIRYRVD